MYKYRYDWLTSYCIKHLKVLYEYLAIVSDFLPISSLQHCLKSASPSCQSHDDVAQRIITTNRPGNMSLLCNVIYTYDQLALRKTTVPYSLVAPKSVFTPAASCLTSQQSDYSPVAPRCHLKQDSYSSACLAFSSSAQCENNFIFMQFSNTTFQVSTICHAVDMPKQHTLVFCNKHSRENTFLGKCS